MLDKQLSGRVGFYVPIDTGRFTAVYSGTENVIRPTNKLI